MVTSGYYIHDPVHNHVLKYLYGIKYPNHVIMCELISINKSRLTPIQQFLVLVLHEEIHDGWKMSSLIHSQMPLLLLNPKGLYAWTRQLKVFQCLAYKLVAGEV